jgi:type IV pilus assembly protein PilE
MRRASGFTLIEIMIVLAILGILAAIAIPNYNQSVLRSRLQEATGQLTDWQARMEQYFQDNRSYADAAGNCGAPAPTAPQVTYFTYTCTLANNNTSFTLTATSVGAKVGGQDGDYVFTLNESSLRRTTAFRGATGLPLNCWISSSGGRC